ncbi:putative amino acid transporter [Aspergillus clavatus NRRL 1]|uniref:Amino acid transporter, putative n=1 Tax=Aspergillus clavatus (strain ATCC 1007 / CBS 513.65 / DSM 816 / NCTC 3887 / NRRL 1 / QM 1276 / 107) TaxID=344612 RepID=A1C8X7_ASPCL|nr:amino acid transporter, putative [Aspergillus clavatus NRRL 1]EAW13764.1 amino acid transporter, putative [Aspergillus clavatus NRRL 1]
MAVSQDPEAPAVLDGHNVDSDTVEKKEYADASPAANDPFGNEECGEVKYRVMSWWQCGTLMVAENISLGILSLPSAMATLGIVPAVILLLGLSGISWYTGYVMGQFKLRYPQIHSMGDAGELLMGRFGRELFGIGQLLFLIFLMASHVLTFTVLFNTITNHGTCTIVFGVVGLIVSFIGALPRTVGKVYWMSMASCISIMVATMVTMISIGVQAPDDVQVDVTTDVSFQKAFLAVTNIIFAYIAHVAFFGFISEMHDPREFPKSLAMLQVVDTTMYIVTAIVIYRYAGPDVTSPALSSAGPLMKKVAYGLAIPTVIIAGVVFGHVACKYIYVRIFRGSNHMHQNSFLAIGSWVAIAFALWVVAWVIAESIPVFNELLSLISALFGSWFSYGLPAIFWLVMNKGRWFTSPSKIFLTIANILILAMACTICGLGLYVSGKSIHDSSAKASWTCKNNAL